MKVSLRILFALLVVACSVAHALDSVPKAEYRQRRVALASKLEGGVAVLFAAEEPVLDFMPYRQDEDFYYLTGFQHRLVVVLQWAWSYLTFHRGARLIVSKEWRSHVRT